MKPSNNWKCSICKGQKPCRYEELNTLGCAKLNLSYAWQGLVWALPLVGKRKGSRIACPNYEPKGEERL